ncbi:MAG TPA: TPM domain-containing protein [Candidatus Fimivivens sp.]|nr:TPM domain-containing protein [Candidatus Fimivivens sp.]
MLKNAIGVLLLLLSITACTKSPAESAKPAKSDYVGVVNDFADQIPFEAEHDLSEKIQSHEQMTGNQVRIVITKDLKANRCPITPFGSSMNGGAA